MVRKNEKRFTVTNGIEAEFCPYCDVELKEAIDHEVGSAFNSKTLKTTLTASCPEKSATSKTSIIFCPYCGENIASKKKQANTKHEVKTSAIPSKNQITSTISCPIKSKTFEVTFHSQTKNREKINKE